MSFIKGLIGVNPTPGQQMAAKLSAVVALLLCGPLITQVLDQLLWGFLLGQWGSDLAPFVFILLLCLAFPVIYLLISGAMASSVGMAFLYLLDKGVI